MKPYILASVMTIAAILIVASCGMCSTGEIGLGQALVQITISVSTIGFCVKGMKNAPTERQF